MTPSVASFPCLKKLLKNTADKLIKNYTNIVSNKAEPERIMIHCMAGLGRTGTFISLLQATIAIKVQQNHLVMKGISPDRSNIMLSPFSFVRKLRDQRYGSVQSTDQYLFIHEFLEKLIK